jgi:predicted membrane-bound mannosyltransferase
MAAATAIGLLVRRWRQRRANDPERVRAAAASAAVREAVSAMDEAIKNRNSVGFFHAAQQAVVERLAERWSVPASRVTPAEIQARLNGSGENICALFKRGEEVAYSHEEVTAGELAQWRANIAQQLAHL